MSLRHSYTLIAPFYDALVAPFTIDMRRRSLASLPLAAQSEVLLIGIGSGLDLPLLPRGPRYTGLDLTPAMLSELYGSELNELLPETAIAAPAMPGLAPLARLVAA